MMTPLRSLGVGSVVSSKTSTSWLHMCPLDIHRIAAWFPVLLVSITFLTAQTPNITVRFANPTFDCDLSEYCVDVEFQSDMENQELFGMNFRFFYEENELELINFRDFQGEYDVIGVPSVSTSGPAFGYNYFGFGSPGNGAADFVNGSIQLVDENGTPLYISTTGWTKIFQVCFHVDDPDPDSLNFCPPLVLDLEQDPSLGGYFGPADEGIVIIMATEVPGESVPAEENVEQINWEYTGDGSAPPYGAPAETDCINIACISCPSDFPVVASDTICENDFVELIIDDLYSGSVTYSIDFGSGAIPSTGTGPGSHIIQYLGTPENESTGASVVLTLSTAGCPDIAEEICKVKVNPFADASINGSTAQGCYYADRVFSPVEPEIPGVTYQWDFGYGAIPSDATGYGPHTVYYDTAGVKTVTLLVLPNTPGAQCPDSSSLSFPIISCPANIVGSVKSSDNEPIPGVNVRLYADSDLDGIADNSTAIRSVFTASTGNYSMATLTPGNYVIFEIQPAGWSSVNDGDPTSDNDIVDNIDPFDNIIPVTLVPSELDGINTFIEGATPGIVSGSVFADSDGDEFPDPGEGLPSMIVKLYVDADSNGVADSNMALDSMETLEDGSFEFVDVPVGTYVLMEFQAGDYGSVKDYDSTNDADDVPNMNTHNDILPLTVDNNEHDSQNYFIDGVGCDNIVMNTDDEAFGSLRYVINCVSDGDTVFFHSSLAGATITINSSRLLINKDIVIFSNANPRITLKSMIPGFFDILSGSIVKFKGLDVISGLSGNNGAAFNNIGDLILENINVYRNPLLPYGQYLIYNSSSGQLFLSGQCHLEID